MPPPRKSHQSQRSRKVLRKSRQPATAPSPIASDDDAPVWGAGRPGGIGIVLGELEDRRLLMGIDLDGSLNPESEKLKSWAKKVLDPVRYLCRGFTVRQRLQDFLSGRSQECRRCGSIDGRAKDGQVATAIRIRCQRAYRDRPRPGPRLYDHRSMVRGLAGNLTYRERRGCALVNLRGRTSFSGTARHQKSQCREVVRTP
jgi:hypothetical protein